MIRKATQEDSFIVAQLAAQMWPPHTAEDLTDEFNSLLGKTDATVFLCVTDDEPMALLSVSFAVIMWRERKPLPLGIWKAFL